MISYREDIRLYWPDWDQKAERNYEYIVKHLPTMDHAIKRCAGRGVCVQAGGHVGLWPIRLSAFFAEVLTFEPDPDLFQCLDKNLDRAQLYGVHRQETALSNKNQIGFLNRSTSSGANSVHPDGEIEIDLMTIDALKLPQCDAIFLDIEGHELEALQGGAKTIQTYRPIIQVEELTQPINPVDALLTSWGYRRDQKCGKDQVYLP